MLWHVLASTSLQGKYKMTMGLAPMNPLDWIEIDECYEEEMGLRKDLIKNRRSIVIHSLPGVRQPSCRFLSIQVMHHST